MPIRATRIRFSTIDAEELEQVAMLVGYIFPDADAEVLDWKPTRSPEREAELSISDIDQMRASLNELRRRRGASTRSAGPAAKYHPPSN
jgi:hypothetical protein